MVVITKLHAMRNSETAMMLLTQGLLQLQIPTSTEMYIILPSVKWVCAGAIIIWLQTPLKNFAAVILSILPLTTNAAVQIKG